MFDASMISRDMTRQQWKQLFKILRRHQEWYVGEDWLEERVALKQEIADLTEDGQVAVVTSGRDCDCVEYVHSSLYTNLHPTKYERIRMDTEYWADGPVHVGLCRPSERPEAYSRDLALEAFEDGHPHIVSSVRFESHD